MDKYSFTTMTIGESIDEYTIKNKNKKHVDWTEEQTFDIKYNKKIKSYSLIFIPNKKGPIKAYFLFTRGRIIVPKKETFIFTSELQSCHLYFKNTEDRKFEIYHENTHYKESEINLSNEQKELIKDFKCRWGYTNEINKEKENSLAEDKPRKWIVMPFFQFDTKSQEFRLYSQTITTLVNLKYDEKVKVLYFVEKFDPLQEVDMKKVC